MNPGERSALNEFRCLDCGKLLAKGDVFSAALEIKCTRCGKLNSLFEDFSEQVILTDEDGVILYANPKTADVTGYSVEEIIGARPSLWGNQMPKEFYGRLWHEIKNLKKAIVVRVTNRHKNGTPYDAILRISPILDKDGSIRYFFGMEQKVSDNYQNKKSV